MSIRLAVVWRGAADAVVNNAVDHVITLALGSSQMSIFLLVSNWGRSCLRFGTYHQVAKLGQIGNSFDLDKKMPHVRVECQF